MTKFTKTLPALLITSSLTSTTLLATNKIEASVNLKNASFHLALPLETAPGLRLKYSSRSLFQGLFGRSWCSNLDLSIERKDDQNLILHNCDTQIPFEGKRVSRWLAAENEYFESILSENSQESDQIEITKDLYIRRYGADTWIFTKDGKLKSVNTKELKATRIRTKTKDEFIIESIDQTSKLQIVSGRAETLFKSPKEPIRFYYKDLRLHKIVPHKSEAVLFKYDKGGNMTRLSGRIEIDYDEKLDRVLELKNLDSNCTEKFEYRNARGPNGPLGVFETESKAFKICGEQKELTTRILFTYKKLKSGAVILVSTMTETQHSRIKIHYHPFTGAPHKIENLNGPAHLALTSGDLHE